MKIYLAGPITGKGYKEVFTDFQSRANVLEKKGYTVLHPMTGKEHLRNEVSFKASGITESEVTTDHAIFARDKWMVDQADIILVNLMDAERVSIGSCFEMAWAHASGKLVVVAMGDDNIHNHSFVLEASSVVFNTLGKALVYLDRLS